MQDLFCFVHNFVSAFHNVFQLRIEMLSQTMLECLSFEIMSSKQSQDGWGCIHIFHKVYKITRHGRYCSPSLGAQEITCCKAMLSWTSIIKLVSFLSSSVLRLSKLAWAHRFIYCVANISSSSSLIWQHLYLVIVGQKLQQIYVSFL